MKLPARPTRTAQFALNACTLAVLAALHSVAQAQGAGGTLGARTLPVLRGVVSGTATFEGPARASDPSRLTITQDSLRAILDWRSFNISADSDVLFVHKQGSGASTLNRIYGLDPSVIQGRLATASGVDAQGRGTGTGGTLILVNQNGILFDRGAQVNVGSLVASTLNLSNERFSSGALSTGGLAAPAFEGGYDDNGSTTATRPDGTRPGTIGVGSFGASMLAAPVINASKGGTVILVAPRIDNDSGLIAAPDGQVILAAGSKAYLALADESTPNLRGLRVEVEAGTGSDLNLTNLIRNAGSISADRGNVTLAALAVNQQGRVSATTAIQANGTVTLKARNLSDGKGGTITLAAGSTTEVMPDAQDTATLPESQSYTDRRGEITATARVINSAGTLRAAGGRMALEASDSTDAAGARIYFDSGSTTSVAGAWADVDPASSLQTFKVTSNELKDSPDQKSGILKGATVTVDLRKGSTLLDLSGYAAAQARTVTQKAAQGGELVVHSSGSVVQRTGATLDASGGGFRYGEGVVAVSQLLGSDGRIYSITNAPQQRSYTALLDSYTRKDSRYNQETLYRGLTYGIGVNEAAYVEGKAGGSIAINAAGGLVLDGKLLGGVTVGPTQLAAAPRGASLSIGSFNTLENEFEASQRIGHVRVAATGGDTLGSSFNAGTALSADQRDQVQLNAAQLWGSSTAAAGQRSETGFNSVEINSNGRITVAPEVDATGPAGASLLLRAPQVLVEGRVALPAGSISLVPQATLRPLSDELGPGRNSLTLGSRSLLSTAGLWINDAAAAATGLLNLPSARLTVASNGSSTVQSLLGGGSVSLSAGDGTSATVVQRGARISVDGGAALSSSQRVTAGAGGSISLANGLSSAQSSDWMQGELSGFAVARGGSLSISTARIEVASGGANGLLPANTTRLQAGLFTDFGFGSFTLTASQGLQVVEGTQLRLQQKNLLLDASTAATWRSGSNLRGFTPVGLLPDEQRAATGLRLVARLDNQFSGQATLEVARNARVLADPGASIALSAVNGLQLQGQILAPAGNVSLSLASPANQPATGQLQLGGEAAIDVSATFVARRSDDGLLRGTLLDAGSITLAASQAGVNLAPGSQLRLNGLARDVAAPASDGSNATLTQHVAGNAGTLLMRSQGRTELDGTLQARAGSPLGAGGAFALELTPPVPAADGTLADTRIVLARSQPALPAAGTAVEAALGAATLAEAGFQKLRLVSENRIELRDGVSVDFARGLRLDTPLLEITGGGTVTLRSAGSLVLGATRDPRDNLGAAQPLADAPVLATRAGTALLDAQGGTVDLLGNLTVNGAAAMRLTSAGDIRLTGRTVRGTPDTDTAFGRAVGGLRTSADLTLTAAQVYPTTRSQYTISVTDNLNGSARVGGYVLVRGNDRTPGNVYSAGGSLTVVADTIVQGGTLRAPLGAIDLKAGSLLELGAGSLTSVSAAGLTIPFGFTRAGLNWSYQDNPAGGTPNLLQPSSADGKSVRLSGANVQVDRGATVDLSGSGDVQALEFVAGNGGSVDTFLRADTYAIVPTAALGAAPLDTDTASRYGNFTVGVSAARSTRIGVQSSTWDSDVYDSLRIGSGAPVAAGDYVLLPARYALLPGAYLVQLQTGTAYANLQPGQSVGLGNGQTVVAGWRADSATGIHESRSVGVVLRPGSAATRESDYTVSTASYFSGLAARTGQAAPRQPIDAGRLTIADARTLGLAGSVNTRPGEQTSSSGSITGQRGEVDISAAAIAVVDRVGRSDVPAGALQLGAGQLSALEGSLLLGGERSTTATGMRLNTTADTVTVANGSSSVLQAPEVLLVARDTIDLRSGSVVASTAAGGSASAQGTLQTSAGGALLRVAQGPALTVDRGPAVDTSRGSILLAAGATVRGSGSLQLDATASAQSLGSLVVGEGGSLSLASGVVSLGETAGLGGSASGLVLSNSNLAALAGLRSLTLKGYQSLDFFGNAQLGSPGLAELTLDSPLLRGQRSSGTAQVQAAQLQIVNTSSRAVTASSGTAALDVQAGTLVLGVGSKALSGFAQVSLAASSAILGQGVGQLDLAAATVLSAPLVQAASGAVQTWRALDGSNWAPLQVQSGAGPAAASSPAPGLGGQLALEGSSVTVNSLLQARSGSLSLAAHGPADAGGITLGEQGRLDAAGQAVDFRGRTVVANAGRIQLDGGAGAVQLRAGSQLNLAAAAAGGNAGALTVSARSMDLQGALAAGHGASAKGGAVTLDLVSLGSLDTLAGTLAQAGFSDKLDLRVRQGDVALGAGLVLQAQQVQIAADSGRVDIAGTVDASGREGGGQIRLWAAQGLGLAAGSLLNARGTGTEATGAAPLSSGGQVELVARGGVLSFDSAATIDVSAGAKGATGGVVFGVGRDSGNRVAPVQLAGTVRGEAARVVLRAERSYASTGALAVATYAADHAAFIAADNSSLLTGLRDGSGAALSRAQVEGATDVRVVGNLSIGSAWDLTTAQWLAGNRAGLLTLRSTGDLTLSAALGNPSDGIRAGDTWSFRLVGGADLGAANALATSSSAAAAGTGHVVFNGNNAKLRTGTGTIEVAAASDFRMTGAQGVLYTAGRIGAADTAVNGGNRWAVDGGAVRITAGRDATGAADEWITEWLRRPRLGTGAPEWWAYRPNFQQGLGTLGGGDILITAGRDVNRLSAMLPTSARSVVAADGSRGVSVTGGGSLQVQAGGNIVGGSYLVARGQGVLQAAGSIGGDGSAGRPTQLYLMGQSSGNVPADAAFTLQAGSSVTLQSVNNPTAMFQANSAGTGPSFTDSGSTQVLNFYSYASDAAVRVQAKSGTVTLGTQAADGRGFVQQGTRVNSSTVRDATTVGLYPPVLEAVALAGDVAVNADNKTRTLYTHPSEQGSLLLLAQGSVLDPRVSVSDRLPATVQNVDNFPYSRPSAFASTSRLLTEDTMRPSSEGRLVARAETAGGSYAIDVQALTGAVRSTTANPVLLELPMASRVHAAGDVSGVGFTLQNLQPGDLSELRSDSGNVRPQGLSIGGPGRLLVQAAGDIDVGQSAVFVGSPGVNLGGLIATGNSANAALSSSAAARMTLLAGVAGPVNLAALDTAYAKLIALNSQSDLVLAFFRALNADPSPEAVRSAANIQALAARDSAYLPYVSLVSAYPRLLSVYQAAARNGSLPLGPTAEAAQAAALYKLLNQETDSTAITGAQTLQDAAARLPDTAAYRPYLALEERYPRIFSDYRLRRSKGGLPEGLTPLLFSDVLGEVLAAAVPAAQLRSGSIFTYQSSIQSYGNGSSTGQGSIDLWAPAGGVLAGLTTPAGGTTIGVLTNAGGAIRSVVRDDFNINQGKVLTAQGGDILLFSLQGNIDAGRGAKTSISTPPPKRTPIFDPLTGAITGYSYTLPAGASGSGIQTLSSDPDGLGPLPAPAAGSIFLFAPGGTIDAGEAGIRSSGNIVVAAASVRNADQITASGSAQGVPKVEAGSLASSLAAGGASTGNPSRSDDAAAASANAAQARAAAAAAPKPTVLSVEVLGFGDKNCKEDDKECFAK